MIRAVLSMLFAFKMTLCDVSNLVGGYNYPQPNPPIYFEEPSTPSNVYLPPIFQDEIIPSELPPIPIPTYLPPSVYPPLATPPEIFSDEDTVVIPSSPSAPLYQAPTPQIKILNMSCVMDASFKTVLRLDSRNAFQPTPVVDNGFEGCITQRSSGVFSVEMEGVRKMTECGVRKCSSGIGSRVSMCVTVRLPTVQGLKLPEDLVVTMQCAPQDITVSHTKHIRFGPTSVTNRGRSSNAIVANGGGQGKFHSRMMLLRKSPGSNNFDQPLHTGNVVLLGEEIVLRATVQDGDGWKYSRMGPVIIRSSNSQKSVTLVEENGCRSAGMKNICPFQPRQLNHLDNILHFRAFLFQEASKGDDMVLSVKMLGCLNNHDCFRNGICDDANVARQLRNRRSLNKNATSNWESQFQFRVQLPQEEPSSESNKTLSFSSNEFILLASILASCIFVIIAVILLISRRKTYANRQNDVF